MFLLIFPTLQKIGPIENINTKPLLGVEIQNKQFLQRYYGNFASLFSLH